jgi:di/tricarboxylate transporter
MSRTGSTDTTAATDTIDAPPGPVSLTRSLGRYFFYGWLFRDASTGSELERAAALRHNRTFSKWLPTYLRRWLVIGTMILGLAWWSERALDSVALSAALAIAFAAVVVFLLVTLLCWALLRAARDAR